ncbi:MAG: phospholipase C [Nocardioides sp.]
MRNKKSARLRVAASAGVAAAAVVGGSLAFSAPETHAAGLPSVSGGKIQHVVVLFDENISFDHYFGTYPYAANTGGPSFTAKAGTAGLPGSSQTITNFTGANSGLLGMAGTSVTNTVVPGAKGKPGVNPNTVAPYRLGYDQAWTCSQGHGYAAEQKAVLGSATQAPGAMDRFVENTSSNAACANTAATAPAGNSEFGRNGLSMSYTDGNVVTGLWNYAQSYAMSDNSWANNFGPSTVGAANIAGGSTAGAKLYYPVGTVIDTITGYPYNKYANGGTDATPNADATVTVDATNWQSYPLKANNAGDATATAPVIAATSVTKDASGNVTDVTAKQPNAAGTVDGLRWIDASDHSKGVVGSITGDPTPAGDICPDNGIGVQLQGQSVGDLLTAQGKTWGSFMGGFHDPSLPAATDAASSSAICSFGKTRTTNPDGGLLSVVNTSGDYNSHHAPFQYYKSTSNPTHVAPTGGAEIGKDGAAKHEYDLSWFYKAVNNQDGASLPDVSYLRPIRAEDAHGGNSDPLDEQHFLVRTVNAIEKSSYWKNTAIVIAYDDSDGFYDQVAPKILNGSADTATSQNTAICTTPANTGATMDDGGWADRCGPSQRLPLLVISPYAKTNFVDHTLSAQSSVVSFIEDNFLGGARVDDNQTGLAASASFDKYSQYSDLKELFDFNAAPHLAPVLLNTDGTVQRAATPPSQPNAALKAAQAKLKADQAKLKAAKKALKKAKGHKKAIWKKKVAKLTKAVKRDLAAVKAAA